MIAAKIATVLLVILAVGVVIAGQRIAEPLAGLCVGAGAILLAVAIIATASR